MTATDAVTYVSRIDLADLLPQYQLMMVTDADVMVTIEVPTGESRIVVNDGTSGSSRFCMTALRMRFGSEKSWIAHALPSRHIIVGQMWQFSDASSALIRSAYLVC